MEKRKPHQFQFPGKGDFFLLSSQLLHSKASFQADGKRGGISKEKQNIHQSSHLATKYGNYDNDKKPGTGSFAFYARKLPS